MAISNTTTMTYQKQIYQDVTSLSKNSHQNSSAQKNSGSMSVMSEKLTLSMMDSNKSLELVYEKSIFSIEVNLEKISEMNPLVAPYLDGLDYTPEATAERIVTFATSFFDVHRAKNDIMSDSDALDSYMSVIGHAIDKGFSEAREILSSLNVLNGEIKDNVDTTYDLVQEKLTAFKDSFSF